MRKKIVLKSLLILTALSCNKNYCVETGAGVIIKAVSLAASAGSLAHILLKQKNDFQQKPPHIRKNIALMGQSVLQSDRQPIKREGKFFNTPDETLYEHTIDALKIFWATKTSTNPYATEEEKKSWIQHDPVLPESDNLRIQWVGHATVLIQINGFNILTDPLFFHLNPILYRRQTEVGISPENLPRIDFVLLSHNHHDHLDTSSMALLKHQQPKMLVPEGTGAWFTSSGFKEVYEHSWWKRSEFNSVEDKNKKITFSFVPAAHWSGRAVFDAHASLWGGWTIASRDKNVYFAGDTQFNKEQFKEIAQQLGPLDACLLPIGPCDPHEAMSHSHMNAEQSVEAFNLLEGKTFIPIHWGTFRLGPDSMTAPLKRVNAAWEELKPEEDAPKAELLPLKFGQAVTIE